MPVPDRKGSERVAVRLVCYFPRTMQEIDRPSLLEYPAIRTAGMLLLEMFRLPPETTFDNVNIPKASVPFDEFGPGTFDPVTRTLSVEVRDTIAQHLQVEPIPEYLMHNLIHVLFRYPDMSPEE